MHGSTFCCAAASTPTAVEWIWIWIEMGGALTCAASWPGYLPLALFLHTMQELLSFPTSTAVGVAGLQICRALFSHDSEVLPSCAVGLPLPSSTTPSSTPSSSPTAVHQHIHASAQARAGTAIAFGERRHRGWRSSGRPPHLGSADTVLHFTERFRRHRCIVWRTE